MFTKKFNEKAPPTIIATTKLQIAELPNEVEKWFVILTERKMMEMMASYSSTKRKKERKKKIKKERKKERKKKRKKDTEER